MEQSATHQRAGAYEGTRSVGKAVTLDWLMHIHMARLGSNSVCSS